MRIRNVKNKETIRSFFQNSVKIKIKVAGTIAFNKQIFSPVKNTYLPQKNQN